MSRYRTPRLPPVLLKELDGLNWSIINGSKHWHLKIAGELVAIWPHGLVSEKTKTTKGMCHDIRRWKRRHPHEAPG